MPYIKEEDRIELDKYINKNLGPINAGQLNYIFTKIILEYIKTKNQSYIVDLKKMVMSIQ